MRRGVTLVEAVLFAALALLVMMLATALHSRASRLFDTRTRQAALQTDARRLLEPLTRHLRSAFLIGSPCSRADWTAAPTLVFYRDATGDCRRRLSTNTGPTGSADYPFTSDAPGATVQSFDCIRGTYKRTGDRLEAFETGGFLTRTCSAPGKFQYDFRPDPAVAPDSKLAAISHVTAFEVTPLALLADPADPTRLHLAASRSDGTAPEPHELALLVLRLRTEDRVADRPSQADDGVFELVTKVWLDERASSLRHPGFFSSADTNLEF